MAKGKTEESVEKKDKRLKEGVDRTLTKKKPKIDGENKTVRWQLEASEKYISKLDSIRIRMSKEDGKKIRDAAAASGKSMNEFIVTILLDSIKEK